MNAQTTPRSPASAKRLSCAAALLFAAASVNFANDVRAQSPAAAPAVTSKESAPEEMVVLSPFEVTSERDVGYTASTTLMGGRINTPLKDTPAAVSVITRQFLDDIGAVDPANVVEWTVNVAPAYEQNKSSFSTYTYNIRNLGASFASRNYVLWYGYSDDFNTERYEFARGPNGTVYGDANVGGIPTTWTKRAQFGKRRAIVSARIDTDGGWRTTADYNVPLSDRLAVRINAAHDHKSEWYDTTAKSFDGAALSAVFRPTRNDELRFDGEFAYYVYPFYSHNYADNASFWDGKTIFNGVTAPITVGTGVAKNGTSLVYVPGAANGGLNNMSAYYATTGTGLAIYPTARPEIPNFPVLPGRDFMLQPSDSLSRLHQYFYSGAYMHRFSDNLFAEVAFTRHDASRVNGPTLSGQLYKNYKIDVNTVLPGGATNPNFGQPYDEREVRSHTPNNNVTQAHLLMNWRFTTRRLNQNFIGMLGTRMDRFNNVTTQLTRTNPPTGTSQLLNNAANIVLIRRYWNQAGQPIGDSPVPAIPGVTLEFVPQSLQYQRKAVDFAQLASVSRLFDDRLALMLGVRYDHVVDSQTQSTGIPVDARGLPQLGAVILTPTSGNRAVPVVGAKIHTDRKAPSKNAGAVYWVRPWFGLVANYAESIASNTAGAAKIDGTIPGIVRNDGQDYGIRFDLFESKVSSTISFYKNRQEGALLTTGLLTTEINRIWDNIGRTDVPDVDYRDTQDKKGEGWEVEVTANPTRSLRLMANLALPRSTIINIRPGLRSYYTDNITEWQAGANNPANSSRVDVQNDINTIASSLASLTPGTPVNDTYDYLSNVYATYTFNTGGLKNFSFGAGANFRGKNKIAASISDPYKSLYSPDYFLVSAHVSYRHKFSEHLTARVQLNVTNLLNNRDYVFSSQDASGYGTYRVGGISTNPQIEVTNNFRQQDPRRAIFSTTFEF